MAHLKKQKRGRKWPDVKTERHMQNVVSSHVVNRIKLSGRKSRFPKNLENENILSDVLTCRKI